MANLRARHGWLWWAAPILVLAGIGVVAWLLATANPAAEPTGAVASPSPVVQVRTAQAKAATPLPAATARATAASIVQATATRTPAPTPTLVPTLPAPPTSSILASLNAVARIAPAVARAQVEAGTAVFVDVRSEAAYQNGHLPGAILMPGGVSDSGYDELPDDRLLIFYCA